jgi:hypothetical protein
MRIVLRLCFLTHLAIAPMLLPAQEAPPHPLYTVDVSQLVSKELDIVPTGTLTFLTEHTLAVSLCRNLRCYLETLDLEGDNPRTIARSDEFQNYSALFPFPDGRLILNQVQIGGKRAAILLDSDLRAPVLIPKATGVRQPFISTTGKTFVKQSPNNWVAYRMGRPSQRIRAGTGLVLSVSDEAVAYLDHGSVEIEGMDGKFLGSFTAPSSIVPIIRIVPMVRFLGNDRLWYESGSHIGILDFNGKTLLTLDRPDGWGVRIGQSSDGNRLLFDRYTRHVPLTQRIEEVAIAAAIGDGPEQKPNGEMVRVIDTGSGKSCFEWNSGTNLLVLGDLHADIDPSGQLVAIMTRTTLNVYKLPESCALK